MLRYVFCPKRRKGEGGGQKSVGLFLKEKEGGAHCSLLSPTSYYISHPPFFLSSAVLLHYYRVFMCVRSGCGGPCQRGRGREDDAH